MNTTNNEAEGLMLSCKKCLAHEPSEAGFLVHVMAARDYYKEICGSISSSVAAPSVLTERASRDQPKKWVGVTCSKSKETAKACELMVRECPATLILQNYKTHINGDILRHIPHQNLGKMTMFATFHPHILTHEHDKPSQNLRLLHPHTSHHFTLPQLHAPYYTVICGLSGSTVFFTLSHKRHLQKIQDLGLYVSKA
jgi:hypothetical protein